MALSHDNNSLNSGSLTLFTKDETSLQKWNKEPIEKINRLGNENNLDPSYHKARVLIISKMDGCALDLGGDATWKTQVIANPQVERSNRNQWIRLEKVDPKQITSPWYLSCEQPNKREGWPEIRWGMNVCSGPSTYPVLAKDSSDDARWLISWDSEGYYRIKNVRNPHYLHNPTGKDLKMPLMALHTRDESSLGFQLWSIERATNLLLVSSGTTTHNLDRNYKDTIATIASLSSSKLLDAGMKNGKVYLQSVALQKTLTPEQVVNLELVDDIDPRYHWRMKVEYEGVFYCIALAGTPRAVVRATPNANDKYQQWYIVRVPLGAFRIQNVGTLNFLEEYGDNPDDNLKTAANDLGSGLKQLFYFSKVLPFQKKM